MSRRSLGDLIHGCPAVPQNPFFSRTGSGPNCKGNISVGRGGIVPGSATTMPAVMFNTGLPATSAPVGTGGAITVAAQGPTNPTQATTQTNPTITGTAVGFGSGRGGYGDGIYRWSGANAYDGGTKGSYNDGWNGNASKIPLSPASLLATMPNVVTGQSGTETTMCDGLTGWVASNPILAAAALAALYFAFQGGLD
jgi:hypothetical protein